MKRAVFHYIEELLFISFIGALLLCPLYAGSRVLLSFPIFPSAITHSLQSALAKTTSTSLTSPKLSFSGVFPTTGSVLAAQDSLVIDNPIVSTATAQLNVNVPASFNQPVRITNQNLDLGTGQLTASNVVYSIKAGPGIGVVGRQNVTISNTGVLSLAGQTGTLNLIAGDGIGIDGLKITNTSQGITSLAAGTGISVSGNTITNSDLGSSQDIFKTIAVSGQSNITAGSNTDTLNVAAGSGVTLTTDPTTKTLTITSSSNAGQSTGWTKTGSFVTLTTISDSVGIGTTSPSNKLSLVGSSDISGHISVGANASVDQSVLNVDNFALSGSTLGNFRETNTNTTGFRYGTVNDLTLNPSGVTSSLYATGSYSTARIASGNTRNVNFLTGSTSGTAHNGTGALSSSSGISSYVSNNSTGSIGNAYGFNSYVDNESTGSITNSFGGIITTYNDSTGTISNNYGLYIDRVYNSGTVTNNYGLYINDQSVSASGTNYNIYSAGSSSTNYFAGNVGIGTNPSEKLQIAGNLRASGHMALGPDATVDQDDNGPTTKTLLNVRETFTTMSTDFIYGLHQYLVFNPSVAPTSSVYGIDDIVNTASGNSRNFNEVDATDLVVNHAGTGTVSFASGARGRINNFSTGTIATAYGGYFQNRNTSTGTISNSYGAYVDSATNSGGGTVTNNYGLYLADQSAVGSTNSFNLYSAGSGSKNYFAGTVGIGATSPEFKLDLNSDGGIIARGTVGSGNSLTTAGAGTRMIWYPKKSAFLAGTAAGTEWDDANIGNYTVALGQNVIASAANGVSIGQNISNPQLNAIALGSGVNSSNKFNVQVANSLEVAFNSNTPTFYVGGAGGLGTYGNVGIDTYSPGGNLDIAPSLTATASTTNYIFRNDPTLSGAINTAQTALYGNYNLPTVNLTGGTSNTLTTLYGNYTGLTNTAGTISTWYGNYIAAPTGAGTTSNKYSLVTEAGAGNVGIGNTSPVYKLDVTTSSYGMRLQTSNNALAALVLDDTADTGQVEFYAMANAGSDKLFIDPNSLFQVNHSGQDYLYIPTTGSGDAFINLLDAAGTNKFKVRDSNAANIFTVNSAGNMTLGTGTTLTAGHQIDTSSGAYLTTSGTWTNVSDRNKKENFTALDTGAILDKIVQLPITEWNYITDGVGIKHIGPVAQDFYSLFGVGNNNTSISTIDPAGIALVGIQQLNKESNSLNDKYASVSAQLDTLAHQTVDLSQNPTFITLADTVSHVSSKVDNHETRIASLESKLNNDVLGIGTQSAELTGSNSATLSALTVTGHTNLNDLSVVGTITSGLLSVDGLHNGAVSVSSLAVPLKIQDNLSANVDFMAGQVVIDTTGNVTAKSITVKKVNIDESDSSSASVGEGTLTAGQTQMIIHTSAVTDHSKIFITPRTKVATPLSVTTQTAGDSFTVETTAPFATDVKFDWWIVN